MRRILYLVTALLLLLSLPAAAAWPNSGQSVMALTEVALGAPVSVTIRNQRHTSGYLVIKTENETATASLVVTVFNVSDSGSFLVCTTTAITTETTTIALLGSTVGAADGITDACDFPMSREITFTFTVTGAGADFDVTADLEWLAP